MTKVLSCRDVGAACDWVGKGETVEEVLAKAKEHAKKDHNMESISPDMLAKAKAAIKDE
jgi:predicted small metal-binding protein